MSTQDKLAEALRVAREWLNSDKWRNSTIDKHKSWEAMMRGIDAALAEYDARGAEAELAALRELHKAVCESAAMNTKELAALKARIADSPIASLVYGQGDLLAVISAENPDDWAGKRVRLVVEN